MECRISDDSPFGRAMLGHVVGDIVEVEAPVGTLKYKGAHDRALRKKERYGTGTKRTRTRRRSFPSAIRSKCGARNWRSFRPRGMTPSS